MSRNTRHHPKGPNGTWKTGQRVPFSDQYADQYGVVTLHGAGATFPPCIGRKGEVAYRLPYRDYLSMTVAAVQD